MTLFVLAVLALVAAPQQQDPHQVERVGIHEASVVHVALSEKGRTLYSATDAGDVHAWDLRKGESLWQANVPPLGGGLLGLSETDDGVVVAYRGNGVHVLDPKNGEREERKGGASPARDNSTSFVADRDGRWVWIGTDGVLIRLTPSNPQTGWGMLKIGNGGTRSVAADPSRKVVAIGGADASIRFVNPNGPKLNEDDVLEGHPGPVTALAFATKGKALFAGCEDGSLRSWDVRKAKATEFAAGHEQGVIGLACSPKGKLLASLDRRGHVKVWELKELIQVAEAPFESGGSPDILFLDEERLAVPSGNRVAVWTLPEM